MRTSIRELRAHTKEFLDMANRGEEVIITYRGKDYVKLTPVAQATTSETKVFGLWKDHSLAEDVEAFVNKLREGRYHDTD